nr:YVTN family beta-propeller repeat protein [Methylocystis sp. SC2]
MSALLTITTIEDVVLALVDARAAVTAFQTTIRMKADDELDGWIVKIDFDDLVRLSRLAQIQPMNLALVAGREGGMPMTRATFLNNAIPVFILLASCGASPALAQAPASLKGTAYVTSWFGGVVTAIDFASGSSARTIPVGVHNHNVALRPDQKQAWVTNNNAGTISIIESGLNGVAKTIQTGNGPRHTYFSPDGKEAFGTNEFDDRVEIFDAETARSLGVVKVGSMPHFALVSGDRVSVSNFDSADATVVSRSKRKTITRIAMGAGPLGAGATKDGKRIYFACHSANHVAVIDGETLKRIVEIPTDAGPVQVTVTPNQSFAYVANDGAGTVQKIDLVTNRIVKTISIAPDAGSHGVGFAGEGRWLLITNTGANTLSIHRHGDG